MQEHELEIEIMKNGEVRLHVKGAKGPKCLNYAKLVEEIVGKMKTQEFTAEYYEPDLEVRVSAPGQVKKGRS